MLVPGVENVEQVWPGGGGGVITRAGPAASRALVHRAGAGHLSVWGEQASNEKTTLALLSEVW